MPSPFPGMDPYLESPGAWPDVHRRLADELSTALNQLLPAPYYACLEARSVVSLTNAEEGFDYKRSFVPDVTVEDTGTNTSGVAVLECRTEVSPSIEIAQPSEPMSHPYVEVRDPNRGHQLITLIEIASLSNKRRGEDRDLYERKFSETFASDASIVELDLLRGGARILHNELLEAKVSLLEPPPDYLVLVNRSWQRFPEVKYQLFSIGLRQALPCIPIPLRKGEKEVPLDLHFVFQQVYDRGPYRRGYINYHRPPEPPLRHDDVIWAHERLRAAGLVGS